MDAPSPPTNPSAAPRDPLECGSRKAADVVIITVVAPSAVRSALRVARKVASASSPLRAPKPPWACPRRRSCRRRSWRPRAAGSMACCFVEVTTSSCPNEADCPSAPDLNLTGEAPRTWTCQPVGDAPRSSMAESTWKRSPW